MAFTLPRDGQRPLSVDGECLGRSSSHRPGKLRWIEVAIFRTESGKYVVAGVGRTSVPGEDDRRWAYVEEAPDDVIRRLERYEQGSESTRYLTRTASSALSQAAEVDEGIRDAFTVRLR